jgi:PAS domain S-box-containing protein
MKLVQKFLLTCYKSTFLWFFCFASLAFAAPSEMSSLSPEKVVLQLRWKHQFQFAGFYAAVHKGFYEREGLQVEIRELEPDGDAVAAVASGKANFGVGLSSLILNRAAGLPLVVLGPMFQHSPLEALVRADSGISGPRDFVGRRIAFPPDRKVELAEILGTVFAEGVSLQKMKLEPFPPGMEFRHLEFLWDKGADVVSVYSTEFSPRQLANLRQQGKDLRLISPRQYGIDFYGDTLFTSEDEVRSHFARSEAFLRASAEGWQYAMQHPEEVADLILNQYSNRLSREELLAEATSMQPLIDADLVAIGHSNPGRWQHIVNTYKALGFLDSKFSLKGFLFSEYHDERELADARSKNIMLIVLISALVFAGIMLAVTDLFRRQVSRSVEKLRESESRVQGVMDNVREMEKKYRELYEGITDPFVSVAFDGKLREFNSAFCELLGYSRDEVAVLTYHQLTPPEWHEAEAKIVSDQVLVRGYSDVYEKEYMRKDGMVVPVELKVFLIRDSVGNPVSMWSIVRDISVRKSIEKNLVDAKSAAEKACVAKSEFLANMSHEIRTPLNGVMGALQILEGTGLSAEQRTLLHVASVSAENLLSLLNDVLDLAKLEAGRLQMVSEGFSLQSVLSEVVEMFSLEMRKKGVQYNVDISRDIPAVLVGDSIRMKQVLMNLVGNAVKFTQAGRVQVVVRQTASHSSGVSVLISVSDTGIGIDPELLGEIFKPFTQADSSINRRFGGTGLGLSICQRIADLLGGRIWAESELGRGSTFHFSTKLGLVEKR